MIVRRWRKTSRDKDACNLILMELKVLTGQWRPWRRSYESPGRLKPLRTPACSCTFSSHLRLALTRLIFLSAFGITFFVHFLFLRYVSCSPSLHFFDFIPGTLFGLWYQLWQSYLHYKSPRFLSIPITIPFLTQFWS
jgi:hypothetical protein